MQLTKQEKLEKFQPFLKSSVFSTLGATLSRLQFLLPHSVLQNAEHAILLLLKIASC